MIYSPWKEMRQSFCPARALLQARRDRGRRDFDLTHKYHVNNNGKYNAKV